MEFNLLDYHFKMDQQKILLYYKGPFDEIILNNISHYLRGKFADNPKAGKKLFAIFMELAQNISFYSAETNYFEGDTATKGIGTIVIHDGGEVITLTAGNLVKNEEIKDLVNKVEEINHLDAEGLRALKREVMGKPRDEGQKTGHIGLIQVALKSEHPLKIESKYVDDKHAFFIISTDVDKS
ncbi:MAG: SiaB family protein kinase [Flammeovirgaceae bacterium]